MPLKEINLSQAGILNVARIALLPYGWAICNSLQFHSLKSLCEHGSCDDISTYWNIRQDHGSSTFVGTSDTINFPIVSKRLNDLKPGDFWVNASPDNALKKFPSVPRMREKQDILDLGLYIINDLIERNILCGQLWKIRLNFRQIFNLNDFTREIHWVAEEGTLCNGRRLSHDTMKC